MPEHDDGSGALVQPMCADPACPDWEMPHSPHPSVDAETAVRAERVFLAASVEVWREVDRHTSNPEGYRGIAQGTDLRKREQAAWEAYRAVLDGAVSGRNQP